MRREAFSILTAIIFLVLVSTIAMLSLSLSTISTKQNDDNYLALQAQLLAKSATEYALLAISGHNFTNNCLEKINIRYPSYSNYTHEINISVKYIGNSLPCDSEYILDNNLSTDDSNRTVIIDTIVTTNPSISTEPIRFHRRTLQKP